MRRNRILIALGVTAALAAPAQAQLFAGTSLNPTGGVHSAQLIDVTSGSPTPLFAHPVWGATFDPPNNRVLYTTSAGSTVGDQLYEWPVGSPTPNLLGTITIGAVANRMDALAMVDGTLYGFLDAATNDGLYTIDLTTFEATLVFANAEAISGIDADPVTDVIWGVDDTTAQIVTIDPVAMTVTPVAAYPAGQTDIDGIAVGGGKVYLVPDEPGSIFVFDIASGTYDPELANPWSAAETFSGAALASDLIFFDDFESGDTSEWSSATI
jgi:hypothetical protein